MSMASEREYVDYIVVDGTRMTINGTRALLDAERERCFDVPVRQAPVKDEVASSLRADRLTDTEKYALNASDYDLEHPLEDSRIRNAFQYYTYYLSGIASNIALVLDCKRKHTHFKNELDVMYERIYAASLDRHGKDMGGNDRMRKSWMVSHYPALTEIRDLYHGFLDEVDIEADKLDRRQAILSRCLTGIENDAKMRGEFAFNPQDRAMRGTRR